VASATWTRVVAESSIGIRAYAVRIAEVTLNLRISIDSQNDGDRGINRVNIVRANDSHIEAIAQPG
jgi:hypothetical protein